MKRALSAVLGPDDEEDFRDFHLNKRHEPSAAMIEALFQKDEQCDDMAILFSFNNEEFSSPESCASSCESVLESRPVTPETGSSQSIEYELDLSSFPQVAPIAGPMSMSVFDEPELCFQAPFHFQSETNSLPTVPVFEENSEYGGMFLRDFKSVNTTRLNESQLGMQFLKTHVNECKQNLNDWKRTKVPNPDRGQIDADEPRKKKWLQAHYKSKIIAKIKELHNIQDQQNNGHFSKCVDTVLEQTFGVVNGDWKAVCEELFSTKGVFSPSAEERLLQQDIKTIVAQYREGVLSITKYKCGRCGSRDHNIRTCEAMDEK